MSVNIFALAAAATTALVPPTQAVLRTQTGGTTLPDGTVQPRYTTLPVTIMVQPATSADLMHQAGLNQSSPTRTVYIQGPVHGLERAHQYGGDILFFDGTDWLITSTPEQWGETQWSRLLVTQQGASASP
ncbi:hypothetical protein [Acetobacter orientalis]|uniref:Burkholderia phage Bcep781 gp06 n=1 Tax=Acetobacter orientalis TaxID=146474 RepID=A0A252A6J5_9PROT|nr:hypothetical protein [Acetobacter orientalis]OUI85182.1 hypothetical protein HK12_09525 [Acetobacter orientalis]